MKATSRILQKFRKLFPFGQKEQAAYRVVEIKHDSIDSSRFSDLEFEYFYPESNLLVKIPRIMLEDLSDKKADELIEEAVYARNTQAGDMNEYHVDEMVVKNTKKYWYSQARRVPKSCVPPVSSLNSWDAHERCEVQSSDDFTLDWDSDNYTGF